MICDTCGHNNPEDNLYCEQCGEKIEYARDRVEQELSAKANRLAEEALEEQIRNALIIVLVVFLAVISVRVMFGSGDWPRQIILPSSTENSPNFIKPYNKSIDDITSNEENWRRPPIPDNE